VLWQRGRTSLHSPGALRCPSRTICKVASPKNDRRRPL